MPTQADQAALRAWSLLLAAHAKALRAIEARLKSEGMAPLAWYDILLELDRAGGRLRIGMLAERLVVEPYNMTRLLDRLETAGLVRRERTAGDRRGAFAVITDGGMALKQRMWPAYRTAILDLFGAALGPSDTQALARIALKVTRHLGGRDAT